MGVRLHQDLKTGYWNRLGMGRCLRTHSPDQCEGRLCDVHNRRGKEPWSNWTLNWRDDRGMMEVIDPHSGIGHPSRAQRDHWKLVLSDGEFRVQMTHGCDGGCGGLYD